MNRFKLFNNTNYNSQGFSFRDEKENILLIKKEDKVLTEFNFIKKYKVVTQYKIPALELGDIYNQMQYGTIQR